jgi:hypothetical protein
MRVRFVRLLASSVAAFSILAVSGCTTGSAALPTLIPVKGKVTYKGRPVTKGFVHFEPDGYGRAATGMLGSDGTFILTTFKEGDGVVAGEHRIYINGTGKTPKNELVPKKYVSPSTSKLVVEVDSEHTEFTFDLADGR